MVNSINSILSVRYYYSTDFFPPICLTDPNSHINAKFKFISFWTENPASMNHYLKQSIHKIACKSIYQKPSYELSAVINPNHIIIFCQFKR
ncbi:hypothetical protein RIR_jg41085.t1 [Rhizophagus irregularis DAOM 181602=DAOM 197198]|nr:hypothetical protein RIR_jg41085.t1 [Rhizophagus irregularis DAOM 181602=DAOM 197198]